MQPGHRNQMGIDRRIVHLGNGLHSLETKSPDVSSSDSWPYDRL
jgi:hypothetical protein